MTFDSEMVALGTTLSRATLTHQGRVFVGLAKSYASDLATVEWKPAQTTDMEQLIGALESAVMAQTTAQEQARVTSRAVRDAVAEARGFLKKLRTALPTALRNLPKGDSTRAMFKVLLPLGSSQARLGAYLTQIRPGVELIQAQLAPLFKGGQPLAALDAIKAKLDAAAGPHGVARRRLPESTMAVNEAKGRLVVKLRELVQRAKIAFDDRPNVVAQFTLDKRSAGRASGTSSTTPVVAQPGGPSGPVSNDTTGTAATGNSHGGTPPTTGQSPAKTTPPQPTTAMVRVPEHTSNEVAGSPS